MGNTSSEPATVIKKRPLARAERNNYLAFESKFRKAIEKEMQANPEWCGQLTDQTRTILREFEAALVVKRCVIENCVWSVYAAVLRKRTLDFVLLCDLVQRLCKAIDNKELVEEEQLAFFWAAARDFIDAVVCTIRNWLARPESAISHPDQFSALFQCLKLLLTMAPNQPPGFSDLRQRIDDGIAMGAEERWIRVMGTTENEDDPIQNVTRICQVLLADANKLEKCQLEIQNQLSTSLFTVAYMFYDMKLCEVVEPVVVSVTQSLKSIQLSEDEMIALAFEVSGGCSDPEQLASNQNNATPDLAVGTAFFELYFSIQQFHKLSASLPDSLRAQVKLAGFHKWFLKAVVHWLDIAIFKALMRIGKAVNLDDFQTLDHIVTYSSSAVDTTSVFYQIKTFLKQLSWPDAELALSLGIKILDDVSRCASFYVETIRLKLERLYLTSGDQPFMISTKICVAVNSIMHVRQYLPLLSNEIAFPVPRDATMRSMKYAFTCSQTAETLTDSAIDNIDAKLDELLDILAERVKMELRNLFRAVIVSQCDSQSIEEMGSYISDQLSILNAQLDKRIATRLVNGFYQIILQNLNELLQTGIENNRQPAYFHRWEELVEMVDKTFHSDKDEANDEVMDQIRLLLKLHGADTPELIHQYRLERMEEAERDEGLGLITIRAVFVDGNLIVDILNARNLKAIGKGGSTDPYVKIQLWPSHHFPDMTISKTKVQKNTLFPLFDESFTYSVPKKFHSSPECYVLFVIKNRGLIGFNEFMGEAFLRFHQIEQGHDNVKTPDLQQIMLPLTKPSEKALEHLEVLQSRAWDKKARDFVKKERKHSTVSY